jgi:hypothetical protein
MCNTHTHTRSQSVVVRNCQQLIVLSHCFFFFFFPYYYRYTYLKNNRNKANYMRDAPKKNIYDGCFQTRVSHQLRQQVMNTLYEFLSRFYIWSNDTIVSYFYYWHKYYVFSLLSCFFSSSSSVILRRHKKTYACLSTVFFQL